MNEIIKQPKLKYINLKVLENGFIKNKEKVLNDLLSYKEKMKEVVEESIFYTETNKFIRKHINTDDYNRRVGVKKWFKKTFEVNEYNENDKLVYRYSFNINEPYINLDFNYFFETAKGSPFISNNVNVKINKKNSNSKGIQRLSKEFVEVIEYLTKKYNLNIKDKK